MVKGINRQVIVVRSPDPSLFEQAIFLLRPDAPESCNVTQDELLRQAQAAAKGLPVPTPPYRYSPRFCFFISGHFWQ